MTKEWLDFVGNCESLSKFLKSKKNYSFWIVVKFAVALLRGFGQVIYANNPISGALIIVTMSVTNPYEAAIAVITASAALLFSAFIGQNPTHISNGITIRNPIMIGIFTAVHNSTFFSLETETTKLWIYLIIAVIISIYTTSAFDSLLGKFGLPCLTLPYNIAQYLLILCYNNKALYQKLQYGIENATVMHANVSTSWDSPPILGYDNVSLVTNPLNISQHQETLVWGGVFSGIVTSTSQVLNLDSVPLAAVMYLSLIIFSPIMVVFSVAGAFCGSLLAVSITTTGYTAIYKGIWGYNTLLCAAAMAGHYYILTFHTAFGSLVCVVFCTIFQYVITTPMAMVNLPLITLPSNISLLLFLSLTARSDKFFPRPEHISFPEKQRYDFKYLMADTNHTSDDTSDLKEFEFPDGKTKERKH